MAELRGYVKQSKLLSDDEAPPVPAGGGYDGLRYTWAPQIVGVAQYSPAPVVLYGMERHVQRKLADPQVAGKQAMRVQSIKLDGSIEDAPGGPWYLPKDEPYPCWGCGRRLWLLGAAAEPFYNRESDGAMLCKSCAGV